MARGALISQAVTMGDTLPWPGLDIAPPIAGLLKRSPAYFPDNEV